MATVTEYWTRYYRDVLGLPRWGLHVAAKSHSGKAWLARVEQAVGPLQGTRLLDVGCGTGEFLAAARDAGASYVQGIEPDAGAVDVAWCRGLNVMCCRLADFWSPIPFDIVTAISTLEHVGDLHAAVKDCRNLLRPGGFLYVHVPNKWSWFEGHYKLAAPPWPRLVRALWIEARGRPAAYYIHRVHPPSRRDLEWALTHSGMRSWTITPEYRHWLDAWLGVPTSFEVVGVV